MTSAADRSARVAEPSPTRLPGSVVPVCADTISAIGGTISAQHPLTWSPHHAHGLLPIQCYFLRDGGASLLIDTGIAVHRDAILTGLATLIGEGPAPRMTMTRWEPDSIINLPEVVRRFSIQSVVWSGPLNPLDFFEGIDKASVEAGIKASTGVTLERLPPGSVLEVGGLELEIIRPNLAVLATYWFYERRTRTLFCSDSFGFVTTDAAGGPHIATDAERALSAPLVRDFIAAKFDWLVGIDTRPIIVEFQAVRASRPIERLCPCFGAIIEGRAAVEAVFAAADEALATLAGVERPSPLAGFDLAALQARLGQIRLSHVPGGRRSG